MTMAEFYTWLAYRQKNGPMNDIRRYDRPAAIVASMLSSKAKPEDFMFYGKDKEPEQAASLADIIAHIGGAKVGKSR